MKKIAFFILINSFIILNLFANEYNSNAIGQKLDKYIENSEFYLIEEAIDNKVVRKLYNNNQLIKTIEIIEENNKKTINTYELDSFEKQIFVDNKIVSSINNDEKTIYTYEGNLLSIKSLIKDDETIKIEKYFYDTFGKLSSILEIYDNQQTKKDFSLSNKEIEIVYFQLGSNYFKESKINEGIINSKEFENDNLINNIDIEYENDIIILVKQDKNKESKQFFKDGILIKEEELLNNILIKEVLYFYDSNYVLTKKIINEQKQNKFNNEYSNKITTINEYVNSQLIKTSTFENDILTSEYIFEKGLKIENLYENGKLYCTITLDNDKIIDIQYREVSDDL